MPENTNKFCPDCKAELPENAKFCLECGGKIPVAAVNKFCPDCRADLPAGAKFCLECGGQVDSKSGKQLNDSSAPVGLNTPIALEAGEEIVLQDKASYKYKEGYLTLTNIRIVWTGQDPSKNLSIHFADIRHFSTPAVVGGLLGMVCLEVTRHDWGKVSFTLSKTPQGKAKDKAKLIEETFYNYVKQQTSN